MRLSISVISVYLCPSAQDNSSSGVNNSSLGTKRGFLGPSIGFSLFSSIKTKIKMLPRETMRPS